MNCWRVTKYDPRFRNDKGEYTRGDWTSFSDIGKTIYGYKLTQEAYKKVEDLYVNVIKTTMGWLKVPGLKVNGLERYGLPNSGKLLKMIPLEMRKVYVVVKEGDVFRESQIANLCRLILREILWCRLEYKHELFVHFGYDYYMYIGGKHLSAMSINDLIPKELFAEPIRSPFEAN